MIGLSLPGADEGPRLRLANISQRGQLAAD